MKSLSKTLLMTSFLLLSACNFGSKESSSQAIIPSSSKYESARKDYVKADGADLLDSEGNKFLLRGTNLGSYYLHERWMALTDSPDMLYTVNKLTERFDRDAAFELLDIYQTNFWTSEDFDAVQALGLNCLRFPISYMDVFDCDFDLMRSDNPTAEELLNMTLTLRKDHLLKMDKFIVEAEKLSPRQVRFAGKNIHDILEMDVDEAISFFSANGQASIARRIKPLQDVGLGYIKLGQPSSTLSGGENQRVKLAYYLASEKTQPTLFIFDEPTTGLHFHDISILLRAFQALIDHGHTIVIIEHNMEVIKCADHIIDLGPEGGDLGGQIVAQGTPEQVAQCPGSHTAKFLREKL